MSTYYFIGIKGAGMSALAILLHQMGHTVKGSDIDDYVFTEESLIEKKIEILNFSNNNFDEIVTADIVVKGNAFTNENNIEVKLISENKIKYITYFDLLQQLANQYISVVISGTHGKTTTTGIMSHAFSHIPIVSLIGDGTSLVNKDPKYFIFEACEYRRHFLNYFPDYLVITNIEFDHPDYFKDLADVKDAFYSACEEAKKAIIIYGDDCNNQEIKDKFKTKVISYGFSENNDFQIINLQKKTSGTKFSVMYRGKNILTTTVPLYGTHMILNILPSIVVSILENLDLSNVLNNLETFPGVKRRFNIDIVEDIVCIDDYAHHPTEIFVTLEATKQRYPNKKIVAIFQPHTFTRFFSLLDEFVQSLKKADFVYITPVFASAREKGDVIESKKILDLLPKAKFIELETIKEFIFPNEDYIYVFMGAGDIQKYIDKFKEIIKK